MNVPQMAIEADTSRSRGGRFHNAIVILFFLNYKINRPQNVVNLS